MLEKIGALIGILGVMSADSPSLFAPFSLIAIGCGLIILGRRLGHGKD